MLEAREKLLKSDEDVSPPAWDSPIGWVDVKVAKRYTYKLVLDPGGDFGSEKLEKTVKVTSAASPPILRVSIGPCAISRSNPWHRQPTSLVSGGSCIGSSALSASST